MDELIRTQAIQGEQIKNIEISCADIRDCLTGYKGLVLRTDRLEQKDKVKTKLGWIVIIAVISLVIKTVGVDIITAVARATTN